MAFQSVVLSVPFSRGSTLMLAAFEGLLDLVGDALAVGGRVVDDRDQVGLVLAGEVARDRRALLVVAADDPELVLKPCSVSLGLVAEPEITGMPAWL